MGLLTPSRAETLRFPEVALQDGPQDYISPKGLPPGAGPTVQTCLYLPSYSLNFLFLATTVRSIISITAKAQP